MLCSICNKRRAIIFLSNCKNGSDSRGYCGVCAQKLGIKPVDDLMTKLGITDEELNSMQDQISEILNNEDEMGASEVDDLQGGAITFPLIKTFFSNFPFPKKDPATQTSQIKEDQKEEPAAGENPKIKKKLKRKFVDIYCDNLSQKAKDNKIDIIIGRDNEIDRAVQILCRRTKNNPCLIGEPGVGKTAIAEGLALKIFENKVPLKLKDKEIHLLDLTALVAGTQFRGQFENRIKGLIDEVKKDGNIILFIDEVHNLVGTGDSEGSMSAANILKPALSRSEIQVIGATTFAEYRKYIEKDAALERRFQTIKIIEPSVKEAINIIHGIKSYYENHHRVIFPENLITKLVNLSERYITDRFLPDKAIDLLDESCACASLKNKFLEEFDNLQKNKTKLTEQEKTLEVDTENTNYEKLAEIRYQLAKINKKIEEIREKALNKQVTIEDISKVVELWTGISSVKIQQNEFKKLENLEEKLKEKIIGQDKAISEIAAAIKRNRVQISPRRRPASFIFVGSTGVGKTELVKVLAKELFDTPDNLIRLDMSEYMEKHSASRIIGSPPGYVGYDESGQITEKVRQKPYSVLLFDEIEKAHPDVMNILLQILDEGKITDSHGRVVNFENTVIVMTSNAGSDKKGGSMGFAKTMNELTKEKAMKALSNFLRPEFLSRVDEIVVFNKLTCEDYILIAKLVLNEYVETLKENNIDFSFDEKSLKILAEKSIDGKNGARDLRNLIRKKVEDKLTTAIIKNGSFNINKVILEASPELNLKIIK